MTIVVGRVRVRLSLRRRCRHPVDYPRHWPQCRVCGKWQDGIDR